MDHLRRTAFVSVGRACGFAGLAIVCVMVGFSYDLVAAARAGGILTLLVTVVLIMKAREAVWRDYRRTELWLMLEKDERPPPAIAQAVTSTVLQDAYFWFARHTAGISVALWLMAVFLSAIGVSRAA